MAVSELPNKILTILEMSSLEVPVRGLVYRRLASGEFQVRVNGGTVWKTSQWCQQFLNLIPPKTDHQAELYEKGKALGWW